MNNTVANLGQSALLEIRRLNTLPVTLFFVLPAMLEGRIVQIKSPGRLPVTAVALLSGCSIVDETLSRTHEI
jgi:hypothetical protein